MVLVRATANEEGLPIWGNMGLPIVSTNVGNGRHASCSSHPHELFLRDGWIGLYVEERSTTGDGIPRCSVPREVLHVGDYRHRLSHYRQLMNIKRCGKERSETRVEQKAGRIARISAVEDGSAATILQGDDHGLRAIPVAAVIIG